MSECDIGHGGWRRRAVCSCGALLLAGVLSARADNLQSRSDAWWTGPLLAPNAATLPAGYLLLEPYLFDDISNGHFDANGDRHSGPNEHDIGSLTYMLYGVSDRITAGMLPRLAYNEPAGEPNSSGVGFGDLTVQAGYGLTQYQDGRHVPDLQLVVQETLPTGRYDRLARASDGFGAGAWTTTLGLYSQDYFWMPNGRILRMRLDLSYALSSSVPVEDLSVYGTPNGFSGRAWPGDAFTADLAGEYSVTRNWVLALDVVYEHADSTQVRGSLSAADAVPAPYASASGSSYAVIFAPAIEYNFTRAVGTIFGVRITQIGRNTTASITPAIAVNMVF